MDFIITLSCIYLNFDQICPFPCLGPSHSYQKTSSQLIFFFFFFCGPVSFIRVDCGSMDNGLFTGVRSLRAPPISMMVCSILGRSQWLWVHECSSLILHRSQHSPPLPSSLPHLHSVPFKSLECRHSQCLPSPWRFYSLSRLQVWLLLKLCYII